MKIKIMLLTMVLLVSMGFNVQTRVIRGIVTSADDGGVLPGVNVVLKGTTTATTTDAQGGYSIAVPDEGGTLVFSFVGLTTQEVKIGKSNTINVTMRVDAQQLSEVVVTGYAEKKAVRIRGQASHFSPSQVTQQPDWNTEEYDGINENIFHDALRNPLSTFSIDVDAASYSNVRRFINYGQRPPQDAVRIEEMINYFDYDYQQPSGDDPFAIITEMSAAPWNPKHKLAHIGLQGKKIATDNLPPSNLVFLIDVSGSMNEPNKLPLLKTSLKMLVNELRDQDYVSIVVYAGAAGLVLEPTSGENKKTNHRRVGSFAGRWFYRRWRRHSTGL